MGINSAQNWSPGASPGLPQGVIRRACYSDRGRQRERNEDACALPVSGADEARLGTLLALADGTGGLPGGAEAGQEAVHYLQALYYSPAGTEHPGDRLRESVEAVNALSRLKQRRLKVERSYITTLVAAVIYADQIWVANVGDSRAYLIQREPRQIQQLTEDHSGYVLGVKSGLVAESDLASQRSGLITRAIGLDDHCQVDTYHYTWTPGDRLLLCSDGLAGLSLEEISAIILKDSPEKAARELVLQAVQVDGSDNCTAIVAAWLPGEQAEQVSGASRRTTRLTKPRSSPHAQPKPDKVPGRRRTAITFGLPQRLRQRVWPLLLGLLLGWLSAAILLLILVESR